VLLVLARIERSDPIFAVKAAARNARIALQKKD
jgi:hypothetical protein